jgi:holo-[acyl-carrier protein] synthase
MAMKGLGVDIVEIGRIAALVARYGDHFLNKVYTPAEIEYCTTAAQPAIHYAGRWAVKEAFYKALPDECQPAARWKSIEVLPSRGSRKPAITIVDAGLRNLLKRAGVRFTHASISHEKSHCVAVVVLE